MAFLLCDLLLLTLQLKKFIGLSCLCSRLQHLISHLICCQTRLIKAASSPLPVPHPSFSSLLLHQFLLSVGGDLTSPLEDWFIFTYIELHCAMFSKHFKCCCVSCLFPAFHGAQTSGTPGLVSSGDGTFRCELPLAGHSLVCLPQRPPGSQGLLEQQEEHRPGSSTKRATIHPAPAFHSHFISKTKLIVPWLILHKHIPAWADHSSWGSRPFHIDMAMD